MKTVNYLKKNEVHESINDYTVAVSLSRAL